MVRYEHAVVGAVMAGSGVMLPLKLVMTGCAGRASHYGYGLSATRSKYSLGVALFFKWQQVFFTIKVLIFIVGCGIRRGVFHETSAKHQF